MRVLHIGKYYPPFYGGIETFMQDLMEASTADGVVNAAVVHHHETFNSFSEETINGVSIYRIPIIARALFSPLAPRFGHYLQHVISKFQPDIIHLHLPNTAALYCLSNTHCMKLPWVVHWHSDVLGENSPWWLQLLYPVYHQLLEKRTIANSRFVIATSPAYAESSPILKRIPKVNISVIPLGIRADKFICRKNQTTTRYCTDFPIAERAIKLLMIGRLTFYKGHHLLLRALHDLSLECRKKFHLTIIGKGEEELELKKLTKSLGISANVTFSGGVSMEVLGEELRSADLLCLPSIERTEAFGVVLMEAASVGVPSLVSDVKGSGMSWVVKNEETGVVVKANDADAIVATLERIAFKPQLLAEWGKQSAKEFDQRFDINKVSHSVVSLYSQVLDGRSDA